jgi:hypothetical protein
MHSESHPNQDEANSQIDHWLASGLQSYVEEGQRIRDASNGISPAKRPIVRCSTTHTASRHEKRQRRLQTQAHETRTTQWRLSNDSDIPLR